MLRYKQTMKTKLFLLPFLCIFAFQTLSAQKEIWGTVSNGGSYGHGYIFKTDSVGNNLQIVHHFDSINGKSPGALLAANNGKLYGITSAGGMNSQGLFSGGVFYEFDLTTSTFTSLQHFSPNNTQISGSFPAGDGVRSLTEVSPGIIYGQLRGAYLGGVIFSYNTATNTISLALNLPTFQGGASNSTTGNRLEGNLFLAPDGDIYMAQHTRTLSALFLIQTLGRLFVSILLTIIFLFNIYVLAPMLTDFSSKVDLLPTITNSTV